MTQEDVEDEDYWYCWEEQDWMENRLFYKYGLEHWEDVCQRESMRRVDRSSGMENK